MQEHFEKVSWVCVFEPFNWCKVAIAIIEALDDHRPNVTEFSNLMAKVCELIWQSLWFLLSSMMSRLRTLICGIHSGLHSRIVPQGVEF